MAPLPEEVAIDKCHADLVYGLIRAHKPTKILELGFGSGLVTKIIQQAMTDNCIPLDFTLVDNWYDWNYTLPERLIRESVDIKTKVITSNEESFIFNCKTKYDFIFSDADHTNSHKWFGRVYNTILNTNGILICHDVFSNDFPNLKNNLQFCIDNGINHTTFSNNSIPTEKCERGLLVVFKRD